MNTEFRCAQPRLTAIDTLVPNPSNPNYHSPEQIETLAKLIKAHGFRHPIIVSKESGYIVVGHGRLMAAMKLGLEQVPVDYQSFESPEMEYAFLVSDNAIADFAELDLSMINSQIGDLGPDFDLELLGIEDFKVDVSEKDSEQKKKQEKPSRFELIECPHCLKEFEIDQAKIRGL